MFMTLKHDIVQLYYIILLLLLQLQKQSRSKNDTYNKGCSRSQLIVYTWIG